MQAMHPFVTRLICQALGWPEPKVCAGCEKCQPDFYSLTCGHQVPRDREPVEWEAAYEEEMTLADEERPDSLSPFDWEAIQDDLTLPD